jgi:hypothetical protein
MSYRQPFDWFSYTQHFCLEACKMDLAGQKDGHFLSLSFIFVGKNKENITPPLFESPRTPNVCEAPLILFFFNLTPTFLLLVGGTTAHVPLLYRPIFAYFELSQNLTVFKQTICWVVCVSQCTRRFKCFMFDCTTMDIISLKLECYILQQIVQSHRFWLHSKYVLNLLNLPVFVVFFGESTGVISSYRAHGLTREFMWTIKTFIL